MIEKFNLERKKNIIKRFIEELSTYNKEYYEIHKSKSGIKSFICKFENCGKTFERVQNFVVHLRVHLDVKHYECEHCQKTFSQKGNLAKHVRKHEIPVLAYRKQLICSVCNNLYTQKYNLRSHMKRQHPSEYWRLRYANIKIEGLPGRP